MECFSVNSGGANHVPPLRCCRSPRRPVRGLGLGRSSGGALHEHDGHHFYSGSCAPLIYSPKTQIYFIHYAFPGADIKTSVRGGPSLNENRTFMVIEVRQACYRGERQITMLSDPTGLWPAPRTQIKPVKSERIEG